MASSSQTACQCLHEWSNSSECGEFRFDCRSSCCLPYYNSVRSFTLDLSHSHPTYWISGWWRQIWKSSSFWEFACWAAAGSLDLQVYRHWNWPRWQGDHICGKKNNVCIVGCNDPSQIVIIGRITSAASLPWKIFCPVKCNVSMVTGSWPQVSRHFSTSI